MTAMKFYDKDGIIRGSYGKKEYGKEVSPLASIPKIPFTIPYDVNIKNRLSFSMKYTYKEKSEDKICKITFIIGLRKYKKESAKDFLQRKQEAFLKIRNYFSQSPETI